MVTAPTATARTAATATGPTGPRARLPTLERLVGPGASDAFLADCFGRKPFRRRLPPGEAARLFSWDRLNAALAEHRLGPPRLKLEKGGSEVGRAVFRERRPRPGQVLHDMDVAALYAQLRDGATLILDAVNELHGPLRALGSGLATEFCASSQTNLYACWGESQGFDIHWDDHDVFVVQVDGRKRWDLYGFTQAAPLRQGAVKAERPQGEPETLVLEPGDLLYLPRGYWHAAVGLGEPSLHLTIGLSRKSGADFLHWLADEAAAAAAVRADLRLEQDDAVLGEQLAGVLQQSLGLADPAELGRRYRRHVQGRRTHRPQLSLPHIGLPEQALAPGDRLRLSEGAAGLEARVDPASVVLTHRGTAYTLAPELGPVVARLQEDGSLDYADLLAGCAAPEALVEAFAREMLRRGVFVLEPEA